MKKRVFLAALACSILMCACGTNKPEATTDEGATTAVTEEESEGTDSDDEVLEEVVSVPDEPEEKEDDLYYTFNPHACPKKLYDAYGPEEWEAFFNLCDALRAGEDSFECANRDVYEWCFSGGPLNDLFPLARFTITPDFINGYSDGKGHFSYDIPVEEFLEKQAAFEEMVVDILKENVTKEFTDFEKCITLYEYMVDNYTYDWEECANNNFEAMEKLPRGTYGVYRTFMDKTGICDDLSAVYDYLLVQCEVDAVQYEGFTGDGHAWSYVTLDGTGYFIDPTWGLDENGNHDLTFFMMTEAEREPDFGDRMAPVIYYYEHENTDIDFSANDDKYEILHNGDFVSLDREQKILYYNVEGEEREFHYDA
ncbi:MAG: hypothetical protein J5537_12795 [Lachnospiraceae bacterium]|nr:hypothetical protein [Lachnospiraceae bacterium]